METNNTRVPFNKFKLRNEVVSVSKYLRTTTNQVTISDLVAQNIITTAKSHWRLSDLRLLKYQGNIDVVTELIYKRREAGRINSYEHNEQRKQTKKITSDEYLCKYRIKWLLICSVAIILGCLFSYSFFN